MGAFMTLGPCNIDMTMDSNPSSNGTLWNPYGWNTRANIFFLDQPVEVGFSYADYGQQVHSTPEAAKDVSAFIALFFKTFDSFKARDFHMVGESFGGRYLPIFASEVWTDEMARRAKGEDVLVNLKSVMIGNGSSRLELQNSAAAAQPMRSKTSSQDSLI